MRILHLRRAVPIVVGVAILAFLALLPVTIPISDDTATPKPVPAPGTKEDPARAVGMIQNGVEATQQFPANATHIQTISLQIGTYRRVNHGTAQIVVQSGANGQWQDVATETIAKERLIDNDFYTLSFSPPLTVEKGQLMRITLRSDGGPNDAITWWTNTNWKPEGFALTYGGRPQEGAANFTVSYALQSGRLFASIGPLWQRMTVFLSPLWQVVLLLGAGALVGSFVALGYLFLQ